MTDYAERNTLFGGLRAAITVADENYCIIFMNDLAIEHYASRGGEALLGTSLFDCHNTASQAQIHQMYARHRANDLIPTRYHVDKGDGLGKNILLIPVVIQNRFRGVAELIWYERADRVFEE